MYLIGALPDLYLLEDRPDHKMCLELFPASLRKVVKEDLIGGIIVVLQYAKREGEPLSLAFYIVLVPFIANGIDLACQFRNVLVGAIAVAFRHGFKPLDGTLQLGKGGGLAVFWVDRGIF